MADTEKPGIDRVVIGIRLDKRIPKVLKGLSEFLDIPFHELVEGIVLSSFEGKAPFSPDVVQKIEKFKSIYGLDLKAADVMKPTAGE